MDYSKWLLINYENVCFGNLSGKPILLQTELRINNTSKDYLKQVVLSYQLSATIYIKLQTSKPSVIH